MLSDDIDAELPSVSVAEDVDSLTGAGFGVGVKDEEGAFSNPRILSNRLNR